MPASSHHDLSHLGCPRFGSLLRLEDSIVLGSGGSPKEEGWMAKVLVDGDGYVDGLVSV